MIARLKKLSLNIYQIVSDLWIRLADDDSVTHILLYWLSSTSEMDFYIAGGNISAIAQCDVQEAHQEKGQHRIDSKKESKRSPF